MSDDEEESFEVERILYQRQGPHPMTGDTVTLYLVKWENYPEEECTWEPRENFDGTTIFEAWAAQWQRGDVLDQYDLKRVEDQMTAFRARSGDVDKNNESEEDSDTICHVASETERSPKRQKLVHEAPLLTKKNREKKGIARPVTGRSISPPSPTKVKTKTVRLQSPLGEPERLRAAAPPLHRPSAASSGVSNPLSKVPASRKVTTGKDPPVKASGLARPVALPAASRPSATSEPPPKFHAVDIRQRKRVDDEAKRKQREKRAETLAENNRGKPFRNLQHQNAMRKKLREAQYVPPTPLAITATSEPTTAGPLLQSVETASNEPLRNGSIVSPNEIEAEVPTKTPNNETDAAQLFFSDSEEDVKQEVHRNDEDSLLRTLQAKRRESTQLSTRSEVQETEAARLPQTIQPVSTHEVTTSVPVEPARPKLAVDTQCNGVGPPVKANVDIAPTNTSTLKLPEPQPKDNIVAANARPERQRRNSLFNQQLPAELISNQKPTSFINGTPIQSVPEIHRSPEIPIGPSRPDARPPQNSAPQLPQLQPQTGQRKLIRDDHITREIVKSDLLCHMICRQDWIGAVKLLIVDFKYRSKVYNSRNSEDKKLTMEFDREMNRTHYNQRSSTKWFAYQSLGLLEPFEDTAVSFIALAHHLEQTKSAVFWDHPFEDFMGVLYPCKSPDWQDLGAPHGRDYEARLCVAFRQKFVESSLQTPVVQPAIATQSPGQATDPRKRSVPIVTRRNSWVTESTLSGQQLNTATKQHEERRSSVPVIQDVVMSDGGGTSDINAVNNDAMDVDEQPEAMAKLTALVESIQQKQTAVQSPAKSFSGIDRSLEDLSSVPRRDAEKRRVRVILVYDKSLAEHAQLVRNWLINNGQLWDQVFDINEQSDKDLFYKNYKTDTWVVLFDIRYRIEYFEDFAKFPNKSNYVLCWQFNYQASTLSELNTRNLYPAGVAVCISEASYITHPEFTRAALRWVKDYSSKPLASSALILPPNIIMTLLDEASLADKGPTKSLLMELVTMTQELINVGILATLETKAVSSSNAPNLQSLEVIQADWKAVYKSEPSEYKRAKSWADVTRQHRDKETRLVTWFSAWASLNLHRHRRFLEMCSVRESEPSKKDPSHHVMWVNIADYVPTALPKYVNGAKKPVEKERGRQLVRKEEEGDNPRSVSRGSPVVRTPVTPAVRY